MPSRQTTAASILELSSSAAAPARTPSSLTVFSSLLSCLERFAQTATSAALSKLWTALRTSVHTEHTRTGGVCAQKHARRTLNSKTKRNNNRGECSVDEHGHAQRNKSQRASKKKVETSHGATKTEMRKATRSFVVVVRHPKKKRSAVPYSVSTRNERNKIRAKETLVGTKRKRKSKGKKNKQK